MINNKLLPLGAMARRLHVTTKWLREQAEQGKLPHIKADDRYLFEPDTVCALFIEKAKTNGLSKECKDDFTQKNVKGLSMTPIDYIRIDADILKLPLCDKAKMLLGLIKSFNSKPLRMSNSELAELLCCSEHNVVRLLRNIRPYIKNENPQSRYRKIFYSGTNAGHN